MTETEHCKRMEELESDSFLNKNSVPEEKITISYVSVSWTR